MLSQGSELEDMNPDLVVCSVAHLQVCTCGTKSIFAVTKKRAQQFQVYDQEQLVLDGISEVFELHQQTGLEFHATLNRRCDFWRSFFQEDPIFI